jgi:hypothetical protein
MLGRQPGPRAQPRRTREATDVADLDDEDRSERGADTRNGSDRLVAAVMPQPGGDGVREELTSWSNASINPNSESIRMR